LFWLILPVCRPGRKRLGGLWSQCAARAWPKTVCRRFCPWRSKATDRLMASPILKGSVLASGPRQVDCRTPRADIIGGNTFGHRSGPMRRMTVSQDISDLLCRPLGIPANRKQDFGHKGRAIAQRSAAGNSIAGPPETTHMRGMRSAWAAFWAYARAHTDCPRLIFNGPAGVLDDWPTSRCGETTTCRGAMRSRPG